MKKLTAGLIGSHIQSTRLPFTLKLMCEEAGIGFSFELIDTDGMTDFDFAATVDDLRARGWTGVTVTHPHKVTAAQYAGAGMRPEVAALGASNTLVFAPDLTGWNTDYTGFLGAWGACMGDAAPGRVAMAGAGGVARALGPALARLGAARIDIWDMDFERAAALADAIGTVAHALPIADAADAVRSADGLVNATALGMNSDARSAVAPALIGGQTWAFDAVYTPVDTVFLKAASAAGLTTISGFELFRHMAIRSFSAYTGLEVAAERYLPKLAALRPVAQA